METVFTAVSDIISTGRGDWVRRERGGGGWGERGWGRLGVQQKCVLIGLDLDTVLSAHSGPPQHPSVLWVHVVQQGFLGHPEVL